ncbi:LamG-like jellyroll fold domain-containing protein [Thermotoga sp. KOL6]|uniref:LamG-like jellyroll fold domain-containing protein n=1 Tax=Thermotoga sp. KOL6 TaxID=126741 RepID=UPI000C778D0A|nr:LamG-like jellyroll fold domain-containing protein [Thermotoga sp. KOL6]PLV59993.1 hypothetical protein AS005_01485 [Thermotoga sp. KOL6]
MWVRFLIFSLLLTLSTVLSSPQPVFIDSFEGETYGNDNGNITFVEGYEGLGVYFESDDSFVRYPERVLPASEGSIEFYWKPPNNIYEIYSYRHESWKNYRNYTPPSGLFLLDNIGWRAAPRGSFNFYLVPLDWKKPDSPNSSIVWEMWDGKKWHSASKGLSNRPTLSAKVVGNKVHLSWSAKHRLWLWDPNKWYKFTVTWGPKGNILYVNGEEWARGEYKGDICTSKSFSLGQDPGYWPYGPHSMLGTYDEFKIYNVQIVPTKFGESSEPAGYVVFYGTGSKSYTESIEVGDVNEFDISLQPGTYYFAVAAKTDSGFVGPLSNEVVVTIPSEEAERKVMESKESVKMFFDDFRVDTGMWRYVGSAYRDTTEDYVVLVSGIGEVGIIWFKNPVRSPFTVEFKCKTAGGFADGMVFMFYKKTDYEPYEGGYLGFERKERGSVPGYGIEFDDWQNIWDSSIGHVALIKDSVDKHLMVAGGSINDGKWHRVKISVDKEGVLVFVDGKKILEWHGELDTTYGGLGFSGATGALGNTYIIDDVRIVLKEKET